MKQFLEYFYILSKLSTSFILFISLMFMGYLLFNSYKSVNYSSLANDNKVENVINLVKENQKAINNISNKLSNNLQSIKEIKHSFKSENFESAKTEIGWGHQIRSYVLQPYRLVKDNRTNYESSDPDKVLNGDLDRFLETSLFK